MNNPTDTNQASEDELRTLDEILSQAFTDGASDTMWIADRHVEIFATAKEELLNLIRTEKLKLLAEVRDSLGTLPETADREARVYEYKLKEQLTKLEAEL